MRIETEFSKEELKALLTAVQCLYNGKDMNKKLINKINQLIEDC